MLASEKYNHFILNTFLVLLYLLAYGKYPRDGPSSHNSSVFTKSGES